MSPTEEESGEAAGTDDGMADADDGSGDDMCWPAADEPPTETTASRMQTWGASCQTDADCVGLLGPGAICMVDAILYELPAGYCSRPCALPDSGTTVVRDAPDCDPDGGVHCVGAQGFFERCVVDCTADAQCDRAGYYCRQMPLIAREEDPTICMMHDCCEGGCGAQ